MQFDQRSFRGHSDLMAMQALARAFPEDHLHTTDLPWRLSSWALDNRDNIGLWVAEDGRLIGWAVLQTPFWTVDYGIDPSWLGSLLPEILTWVDARVGQIHDTLYGHPAWYSMVFADQAERIRELEHAGWASQADVGDDSWSKVWMHQRGAVPAVFLPDGFGIRPLAGQAELEAYAELQCSVFESKNMTADWRRRTLEYPGYFPETDLVVVAPDGRLAALCIGWLDQKYGQIEPCGVRSEFRSLGLGKAILVECVQRLYAHGADQIHLETDSYRNAALELYKSVGFHVVRNVLVFRKDYG
jgi:ribosomal protein S18 acetylase RimI-like enzyme